MGHDTWKIFVVIIILVIYVLNIILVNKIAKGKKYNDFDVGIWTMSAIFFSVIVLIILMLNKRGHTLSETPSIKKSEKWIEHNTIFLVIIFVFITSASIYFLIAFLTPFIISVPFKLIDNNISNYLFAKLVQWESLFNISTKTEQIVLPIFYFILILSIIMLCFAKTENKKKIKFIIALLIIESLFLTFFVIRFQRYYSLHRQNVNYITKQFQNRKYQAEIEYQIIRNRYINLNQTNPTFTNLINIVDVDSLEKIIDERMDEIESIEQSFNYLKSVYEKDINSESVKDILEYSGMSNEDVKLKDSSLSNDQIVPFANDFVINALKHFLKIDFNTAALFFNKIIRFHKCYEGLLLSDDFLLIRLFKDSIKKNDLFLKELLKSRPNLYTLMLIDEKNWDQVIKFVNMNKDSENFNKKFANIALGIAYLRKDDLEKFDEYKSEAWNVSDDNPSSFLEYYIKYFSNIENHIALTLAYHDLQNAILFLKDVKYGGFIGLQQKTPNTNKIQIKYHTQSAIVLEKLEAFSLAIDEYKKARDIDSPDNFQFYEKKITNLEFNILKKVSENHL